MDFKSLLGRIKTQLEEMGFKVEGPELIPQPIGYFDTATGELKEKHIDNWTLNIRVAGTAEKPSPNDIEIVGRAIEDEETETLVLDVSARFLSGPSIWSGGNWASKWRATELWDRLELEIAGLPDAIKAAVAEGPRRQELGNDQPGNPMIGWPERIARLRRVLDLTQRDFADLLNMTNPAVNRWENGIDEPSPCAERFLEYLEQTLAEGVEFLRSVPKPLPEPAIPWQERIALLIRKLNVSQHQLAAILGVTDMTVSRWLRGVDEPNRGCGRLMVWMLEQYSDMPLDWPSFLLVKPHQEIENVPPERVRQIRNALDLDRETFADLLGVVRTAVVQYESGVRGQHWCPNLLLRMLDRFTVTALHLLRSVPQNTGEWTADRFRNIRENVVGISRDEMARLLGTSYTAVRELEEIPNPKSARCVQNLFWLIENRRDEILELAERLINAGN